MTNIMIETNPDSPVIGECHTLGEMIYDPVYQCSPGNYWPSMNDFRHILELGGSVFYTRENDQIVFFLLVDTNGRIEWGVYSAMVIDLYMHEFIVAINEHCGACYGWVQRGITRDAIEALPGVILVDGWLNYQPVSL